MNFISWNFKVCNMKIDLFRNREIPEGENPYEKEIKSNDAYNYVLSHIEFKLTKQTWVFIDKIFSEIWNSKIGLGGSFYWDEIEEEVLLEFKKHRILLFDNDVKTVVHLILEYIEQIGGIIE
jgi:hypothetical protein